MPTRMPFWKTFASVGTLASSRIAFSAVALDAGDGSAATAVGLAGALAADGFGSVVGAASTKAGVCCNGIAAVVGLIDWRMKNHATAAATSAMSATLTATLKPRLNQFPEEVAPSFRCCLRPPDGSGRYFVFGFGGL